MTLALSQSDASRPAPRQPEPHVSARIVHGGGSEPQLVVWRQGEPESRYTLTRQQRVELAYQLLASLR